MTTTKQYDRLNRLKSISSIGGASSGSPILSSFDYQYNQANQRVKATLEDGSAWDYAYDLLGQVTSGKKRRSDRTPEPDEAFDYQHDDIGNRKEAGGQSSARTSYAANALNQYIQRIDSQGPGKTETLQYDTDGNLIADGAWKYTWDAENRLVAMESGPNISPEQRQRLEFAYDSQSRRISKKVYAWESARSKYGLQPSAFNVFIYAGWNLLAELTADLQPRTSFVWGLDLSGSRQGAGGVGGLLRVSESRSQNSVSHFVAYDGNGNVTTLVDAQFGTVSGSYGYGAFGEEIRATGDMAKANPFHFSTKYTDDETGLIYYGYRYYDPLKGRFANRDVIAERGSKNVYGFANNNPLKYFDFLGRQVYYGGMTFVFSGTRNRLHFAIQGICTGLPNCDCSLSLAQFDIQDSIIIALYSETRYLELYNPRLSDDQIAENIVHEQLHLFNVYGWHDANSPLAASDFSGTYTCSQCESTKHELESNWTASWNAFLTAENMHIGPDWEGINTTPPELNGPPYWDEPPDNPEEAFDDPLGTWLN